jgi:hypothetical protein
MGDVTQREISFELVCELTSEEKWCWNIFCTTCGHVHFRYALFLMSKKNLVQENGLISIKDKTLENRFGHIRQITSNIRKNETLHTTLTKSNLIKIASKCRFPDYLGYFGLALHYTSNMENNKPILTKSWSQQLLEIIQCKSPSEALLNQCLKENGRILKWTDLEIIESDVKFEFRNI